MTIGKCYNEVPQVIEDTRQSECVQFNEETPESDRIQNKRKLRATRLYVWQKGQALRTRHVVLGTAHTRLKQKKQQRTPLYGQGQKGSPDKHRK